jgi:hypothetical protein
MDSSRVVARSIIPAGPDKHSTNASETVMFVRAELYAEKCL